MVECSGNGVGVGSSPTVSTIQKFFFNKTSEQMRLILFLVLTISCEIDKPKCDNACMVNRLEILNKRVKELENHIYVQYSENTQKNLN